MNLVFFRQIIMKRVKLSGAQNRKRKAEKEGDARKNASIFSNYLSKQELNNNFENIPSSMSSTHTRYCFSKLGRIFW